MSLDVGDKVQLGSIVARVKACEINELGVTVITDAELLYVTAKNEDVWFNSNTCMPKDVLFRAFANSHLTTNKKKEKA